MTAASTIEVEALQSLAEQVMAKLGYAPGECVIVANHLVDAARCGYPEALGRLLTIADEPPRNGRVITVAHELPGIVQLDGGGSLGYLALHQLTSILIDKARTQGLAVGGVHNCAGGGRSAHYLERVARAGFVGLHTASGGGAASVAPPGARRPLLGTNPIAFGFPTEGEPVIFDMGTAAITMAKVKQLERLGQPLAEGAAIDADGHPTTDPAAAVLGSLLTFGGYKGFGLSLSVQLLGLLADAANDGPDSGYGSLMIVIDPDALLPKGQFARDARAFIDSLKGLPRIAGVDEIRIPSERAFALREATRTAGVAVPSAILDRLRALS